MTDEPLCSFWEYRCQFLLNRVGEARQDRFSLKVSFHDQGILSINKRVRKLTMVLIASGFPVFAWTAAMIWLPAVCAAAMINSNCTHTMLESYCNFLFTYQRREWRVWIGLSTWFRPVAQTWVRRGLRLKFLFFFSCTIAEREKQKKVFKVKLEGWPAWAKAQMAITVRM